MNDQIAFATENLTRNFGSLGAVDHLTLEGRADEVFGFPGHNGAGKTTTVRLLNWVLAPTSGTARVLGLALWVIDGALLAFGRRIFRRTRLALEM
jgi:ABC-type multidrug transport system ATPase subunit